MKKVHCKGGLQILKKRCLKMRVLEEFDRGGIFEEYN